MRERPRRGRQSIRSEHPRVTASEVNALHATTSTREAGPRALIMTVYGLYARQAGGWLSVSALIRLLSSLGVEEPAVRSAVSRLKRRGVLEPRRMRDAAGYRLSAHGRDILAEGDRRIFERPRGTLSEGWLLAVYSVPESERGRRHRLRSRLTWLGFGTAASGVRIAPAHLYAETREVLLRDGLSSYVDLFRGRHLDFDDVAAQVRRWWDLDGLQRLYDQFHADFSPMRTRWGRRGATDEAAAFADYARALTAWRKAPFLDPGLPFEVLPENWHGLRAGRLFDALTERLADPARRHIAALAEGRS